MEKETAKKTSRSEKKAMENSKRTKMAKTNKGVVIPPSQRQKWESDEKKPSKKAIIIASIAVFVALVASAIGVTVLVSNQGEVIEEVPVVEEEPEEEPEPEPEENEDELVDEPEINDNNTYQVAAYKPRYLSIPSLGLYNIPVIEVGKGTDGTLGAPQSDYVIAWYYRSALPGQAGATVMDGHGGDLGTGILKTLPRVAVGAPIIVEMGDGRKFTYTIEEKVYKYIDAPADNYMTTAYTPVANGVPTLTLITCTGAWLRNRQTYDQRLFVRAAMR